MDRHNYIPTAEKSEPSSEIVGQVRRGSMGLTAEQDIMTMEMRLSDHVKYIV